MRLILDSNIFIFAFGEERKLSCEHLIKAILETPIPPLIRIPRLIVGEVRRNLTPEAFREFVEFITALTTIDEDEVVPFELGVKYESLELKPADSFIASFAEFVGANVLVSENRHFMLLRSDLPFKILNAEDCLKLLHKK